MCDTDWDNWTPTSDNINALPEKLRKFVCDLETIADYQCIIAENIFLKDELYMFIEGLKIKQQEDKEDEQI